jgi:hypothetical protein
MFTMMHVDRRGVMMLIKPAQSPDGDVPAVFAAIEIQKTHARR